MFAVRLPKANRELFKLNIAYLPCVGGADIVERSEIAFYGQRDKMMSVSDYARKHGVDPSTVRHKISRGLLPAVKIGKMWLVKESEPWTDQRRKK